VEVDDDVLVTAPILPCKYICIWKNCVDSLNLVLRVLHVDLLDKKTIPHGNMRVCVCIFRSRL
jgi:hypothetical protein